jgi:hypothetical protein
MFGLPPCKQGSLLSGRGFEHINNFQPFIVVIYGINSEGKLKNHFGIPVSTV